MLLYGGHLQISKPVHGWAETRRFPCVCFFVVDVVVAVCHMDTLEKSALAK